MIIRFIPSLAAAALLALAGPVAAQVPVGSASASARIALASGKGFVVAPPGIARHPRGGDTETTLSLVYRRPGQPEIIGGCTVAFLTPPAPQTMPGWTAISQSYLLDAEAKSRDSVSKMGGVFERMLDTRASFSSTGWGGWFNAYQWKGRDGVSRSSVLAGGHLSPTVRVVTSCTTTDPAGFTKSDLDTLYKLVGSVGV